MLVAAAPLLCGLRGGRGGLCPTFAPSVIAAVHMMAAPCPELEGVRPGVDHEGEMEESEELWATSSFEAYIQEGEVAHPDDTPEWVAAYETAATQHAGARARRAYAAAARQEAEANLAYALAEVRRQREIALGRDQEAQAAEAELAARRRESASQASLQMDMLEESLQQAAHKHLALGVHAAEGRATIAAAEAEAEWQGASRTWELRERAATAAVATAEAEMRRAEAHMELAVSEAEEEMGLDEAMLLIQSLYQREFGAGARGVELGEGLDEGTRDAELDHDTRLLVTVRSAHGQRTQGKKKAR